MHCVRFLASTGPETAARRAPRLIALVPTGFCYPGSGSSGDLPPRHECAPFWHPRILPLLTEVRLTIYLGDRYKNLSEAAEDYSSLPPRRIVLPHPSPRNSIWAAQRPWCAAELLPLLQARVSEVLFQ